MTGPEHYQEAERIGAAAKSRSRADDEGFTGWSRSDLAALAQVHATLALVAATIDAGNSFVYTGNPDVQSHDVANSVEWAAIS